MLLKKLAENRDKLMEMGKDAFEQAREAGIAPPSVARPKADAVFDTNMIVPADFESLALLCWNRDKARPIDRETAWLIYRRNWRLVWQETLGVEEIALIKGLTAEFGEGETLLGTAGTTGSPE